MLRTIVNGERWTGVVLRGVPVERSGWTVLWFESVEDCCGPKSDGGVTKPNSNLAKKND